MTAEVCNNAYVHMLAHIERRSAAMNAKPQRVLMLAGCIVTSQPAQSGVQRAAERGGEALRRATTP